MRQLDALDVDLEILIPRDGDSFPAGYFGGEGVHSESRRGDDDVVPNSDVHPVNKVDNLVAAVSGHDHLGGNTQVLGEHVPQMALVGVSVVVVKLEVAQGFQYFGRRPVGVFIPVQADYLLGRYPGPLGHDLHGIDALVGV